MSFSLSTAAGDFLVVDDDYALVAGFPSATPAWVCVDIDQLYLPAPIRSSDPTVIPGTDGVIVHPLYLTALDVTLTWVLRADFDPEGVAHPSVRAGLAANLAALKPIAAVPASTTVHVELHFQGEVLEGEAQVLDMHWPPSVADGSEVLIRLLIGAGHLSEPVSA